MVRKGMVGFRYQAAQSGGRRGVRESGNSSISGVLVGQGVCGFALALPPVEDCSCVGQPRYRWWRHRSCCEENDWRQCGIRDADARLRRARVELTWWCLCGEIEEAEGKRRLDAEVLLALRRGEAKRQRLVRRAVAVEVAKLAVGGCESCLLRCWSCGSLRAACVRPRARAT